MKKRILSILLTLVMVIGMLPAASLTAHAASNADAIESITINGTTITGDDLNGTISESESESDWTWKYSGTGAPIITLDNYNGGAISVKGKTGASAVHIYINVYGTCNISSSNTDAVMLEAEDTGSINFQLGTGSSLTMTGWNGVNNASKKNPIVTFSGSGKVSIQAIGGYGIIAEQSDGEISTVGTVTVTEGTELVATAPGYVALYGVSRVPAGIQSVGLVVNNGASVKFVSTGTNAAISREDGHYDKIVVADGYTKSLSADGKTFMLYKPTVVSEIGVKDIAVPVVGEKPDYSATTCGNGYEIKDIDWSYYDEMISNEDLRWVTMNSGDTFKSGEKYLCTVEVVPSWNATFPDAKADLSAEFNDENANISPVYDASKAYVEKEFTVPHAYVDQPDDVSVYVNKKAPVTFTFSDGAKYGCVEYEESEGVWKHLYTFDHEAIVANNPVTIEIPAKDTAQTQNYRIKLQATSDSKIYISDEFTVEWKVDPYIDHPDDVSVNVNEKAPVSFTFSDGAKFGCVEYEESEGVWKHLYTFDHEAIVANNPVTIEIPAKDTAQTLNCHIKLQAASDSKLYISDEFTVEWKNKAVEPNKITEIALTGNPVLEVGKQASEDISVFAVEAGHNYTVTAVGWWDVTADGWVGYDNLIEDHEYRAHIEIEPNSGYEFAASLNATMNGNPATVNNFYGGKYVVVVYNFGKPKTDEGGETLPTKYTVTYTDGVDDVVIFADQTFTVEEGSATPTISNPTRSGYTFTGWTPAVAATVTGDQTYTATWDKNSTGGGVVIPTVFPVNVKDSDNGEVKASAKYAAPGSTIKLTVTPDEGYELDTLTVKSGSKFIDVTEKNGKYQFVMPFGSVTVTATFKKIETPVVPDPVVPSFDDVAEDTYYFDAVEWAVENGITTGTSDTTFSPDMTCTRAQAVTFLWRAAGSPEPKSNVMPFEDVAAEAYYYKAVLWAVENGITKGTSETTFSPDAYCTRAQIVTFLWRAQKSPAADSVNPFTDVAADAYYVDAVLWAVEEKVTKGTSATTFSPDADCTRAQIVTFLYRALNEQ